MNKTKIEWCDYTWNPITGCTHGCSYCYARKIAMRFDGHFRPTFHKDRLNQPSKLKKPSKIFVCSMGDIFDPQVKGSWVKDVANTMCQNDQHEYFILTKQPQRIDEYYDEFANSFPQNLWMGVSVARVKDLWRIKTLKDEWQGNRFISFEPLLEDMGNINLSGGKGRIRSDAGIDWIIIGGQSGPTIKPPKEWIDNIMRQASAASVPVFLKKNTGLPKDYKGWME